MVTIVDGELTIERLRLEHGRVGRQGPDIVVPELAELSIWVSSPVAFTDTMKPNWQSQRGSQSVLASMVCTEIPFEQGKQRWAIWGTSTAMTSRRRCWSAS